jgi:peptide/nickel transport system permease protein
MEYCVKNPRPDKRKGIAQIRSLRIERNKRSPGAQVRSISILVLLLVITFYWGANLQNLIFALGFLTIPAFSRVARAKALTLSDLEFVLAARLSGAGHWTILFREIIPNVAIPLAIYGLLVSAFMIMAEGALSFLGLGVPAPTPSWGGMIAEGREVLDEAPHVSMIPATIMFLTVLAFNIAGDSLRHAFERGNRQI